MTARSDLSVFKVSAWTTRPKRISESKILVVPKPLDDESLLLLMWCTLKYTVYIRVRRFLLRLPPDSTPPSPPPTPPTTESNEDDSPDRAPRGARSHERRSRRRRQPRQDTPPPPAEDVHVCAPAPSSPQRSAPPPPNLQHSWRSAD